MTLLRSTLICALLASLLPAPAAPRVFPEGKLPNDARLAPPKDLHGYFPFVVPETKEAWAKRRAEVKRQMLAALGLLPLPPKTPLNPVIHGRRDQGDYTVEKVYFESWPGFFVTGNLYRPKNVSGKTAGVLCPHGHWPNGRFMSLSEAEAKKDLESGAEKFLCAAKSPLQARCVHLARMGMVVFHYDMLGYADSQQLSMDLVHHFSKTRPEMNGEKEWGFYSPQAEGHLQSVMGLQAWNGIRALDFITSLPEVEPSRIGVTGASGGGTQTFILGAIDDRPAAVFPAVMVSTAMQGGCTCENASLLRVGTGNVEFAAMFAPKPQGLTAADDWTREMETKGFPELKKLYTLLGSPENVSLLAKLQFPHNYNLHGRTAMYQIFAKHLLGKNEVPEEKEFEHLTQADLTVWDEQHPKPEGGDAFEKKLTAYWAKQSDALLKLLPESVAEGFRACLGRDLESAGKVEWNLVTKEDRGDYLEMTGSVKNLTHGEELPAAFFYPKNWNKKSRLILSSRGKACLYGEDGKPTAAVQAILQEGDSVGAADLLFQGEFVTDPKASEKNRKVANPRLAAAYTYGYNHTLFVQRVHDVLTLLEMFRTSQHGPKEIHLIAQDDTSPIAAAAASQCGTTLTSLTLSSDTFDFAKIADIYDANFFPGALKYGGMKGLLSLCKAKVSVAGK